MTTNMPKTGPRVVLRHAACGAWLHFTTPYRILTTQRMDEVLPLLRQIDAASQQDGVYAAGFIAYEATPAFDASLPSRHDPTFPLIWFGLFRQISTTSHLPASRTALLPQVWQPSVTPEQYQRCLHSIRTYIGNGDTYQVNFTYRLHASTDADPWNLFLQILGDDIAPYAAFVDTGEWTVCSVSPELFFLLDGDQIESRPMKGTTARGLWFDDDQRQAIDLRSSPKQLAENVMIVDMMRNDIGRIALPGSVHVPSLFAIEQYPTLWQMTSTVRARTRASLDQILAALFPPASITGAPKRRTMEIIAELETLPRRVYTGTIGFVGPERQAQFNVAIRTILMHQPDGQMEYGVGGGIVWDSEPVDELAEAHLKARILQPRHQAFDLLETLLWSPHSGYVRLDYHLHRLGQSADYFGFPVDRQSIRTYLQNRAGQLPALYHRIRLTVTREGSASCTATPVEPAALRFGDIPLARQPVDARNVFLYHKTTCRHMYEEAVRLCSPSEDVLLFNQAGEITESTVANVAVEIDGVLYTPPVQCGLLAGTYRAWLLDQQRLQERVISCTEVLHSPNVYLLNAIRGMQKIRIVSAVL